MKMPRDGSTQELWRLIVLSMIVSDVIWCVCTSCTGPCRVLRAEAKHDKSVGYEMQCLSVSAWSMTDAGEFKEAWVESLKSELVAVKDAWLWYL